MSRSWAKKIVGFWLLSRAVRNSPLASAGLDGIATCRPGVPIPRLRASGMLHAAAAANPVAHEIGHRHVGLASGVRVSNSRLVDDLRNSFVRKGRGADVDQRSEPGHGRARRYTAEAKLGDGWRLDPARILLAQTRESRLAGPRAYQTAADHYDAPVLFHDFFQRADEGLSKSHFLRHGLITSSCISKVERGFWIRKRAFQGETRRRIGFLTNRLVQPLNLITADASVFDQLAREDKHRITFRIPGATRSGASLCI